jgi:cell division protein FtsB
MNNQTQHIKTLQILLWLWFGTITSFASVNVINIAKLEAQNEILHKNIDQLRDQIIILNIDIRKSVKQ